MRLERNRLQTITVRIDIQILVRNKEEIVLLRGAKPSQAGQDDVFLLNQNLFQTRKELCQNPFAIGRSHIIGLAIEIDQPGIILMALPEEQAAVGRIDGVTLVREGSRNNFSDKTSDSRKRH